VKKAGVLRVLGALGALVALTVVGAGVASAAGPAHKGEPIPDVTIKIKGAGENVHFEAPKTIQQGAELAIKNQTDPEKIGPHTFSLIKRSEWPRGKDQIKKCAKQLKLICGAVAFKWHLLDPQTFEIGRPLSDVNAEGWDTEGDRHHRGDSWVAQAKGELSPVLPVSSKPRTLYYMCVVHPFMRGKIEVTAAPPAKG
jgi:hypothetical protein